MMWKELLGKTIKGYKDVEDDEVWLLTEDGMIMIVKAKAHDYNEAIIYAEVFAPSGEGWVVSDPKLVDETENQRSVTL